MGEYKMELCQKWRNLSILSRLWRGGGTLKRNICRAGEPGVFGSLEPEPLEEKTQEPGPEPLKICRLLSPTRR